MSAVSPIENLSLAEPTPQSLSPEQLQAQRLGDMLRQAMSDPCLADCFAAMVTGKQIVRLAAEEAYSLLLRQELPPDAFDYLLQAVSYTSAKPFDVAYLANELAKKNGVLAWLGNQVDDRIEAGEKKAQDSIREELNRRRQLAVHVGHTLDPLTGATDIPRGSSLTFAGYSGAVRYLLHQTAVRAMDHREKFSVVRLCAHRAAPMPGITNIPAIQWARQGGARAKLVRLLAEYALATPTDLLIVDDLPLLADLNDFKMRTRAGVAGDVHKYLLNWCKDQSVALACGVGFDESNEEFGTVSSPEFLTQPGWEQLKQFSRLLHVTCKQQDKDSTTITAGKTIHVSLPTPTLLQFAATDKLL